MVAPVHGEQWVRVAASLDAAATHAADALKGIRMHRSGDLAEVRTTLDEARTLLAGMGDDFAGESWPIVEARRAADELLDAVGTARRARTRINSDRVIAPLKDAIAGAQHASRRFELVSKDAEAVARGDLPAMFTLDAAPTRAATGAELERLLARGNTDLTDDELRRVALLAELPASMRPPIESTGPLGSSLSKLSLKPDLAERFRHQSPLKGGIDSELNNVRLAVQAPRYAADPALTADAAADELVDLLVRPNRELMTDDLKQFAFVASLPDELRAGLPRTGDAVRTLRRDYIHEFQPRHQLATYVQFQDLRAHVLATMPDRVARKVSERVAADQMVSSDMLAWLADLDDAALARFGLTREHLLARTLRMVGDGKADGWSWGRAQFHAARKLVDEVRVEPEMRPLLDDLRTRLDGAISQVERQIPDRADTPRMNAIVAERWPDFGEVGRATSTAELIHRLNATPKPAMVAETLAW
jgi:hypothetical protein